MNIEENFKYHKPDESDIEKYFKLREKAKELAFLIDELCTKGSHSRIALMRLKECIMWANASVALKDIKDEE